MLINELPLFYRELAEKRRKSYAERNESRYEDIINQYELIRAFPWTETTEGYDFWERCDQADLREELPPIPNTDPNEVTVTKEQILEASNKLSVKEALEFLYPDVLSPTLEERIKDLVREIELHLLDKRYLPLSKVEEYNELVMELEDKEK